MGKVDMQIRMQNPKVSRNGYTNVWQTDLKPELDYVLVKGRIHNNV